MARRGILTPGVLTSRVPTPLLLAPVLLAACAAVGGTVHLSGTAPLGLDLQPGTRLIYRLHEPSNAPEGDEQVVTSVVVARLTVGRRNILDPLLAAGAEPVLGRTRVRLTGTAFRLETRGGGAVPAVGGAGSSAIWANSDAGIVRLTSPDAGTGRLIGPAFGVEADPYWDGLMAWAITSPDTTLTVPAGTFRCTGTTTWFEGGLLRLSWWADGIGLVRWEQRFGDLNTPGMVDEVWVLSEVISPAHQRPSSSRR